MTHRQVAAIAATAAVVTGMAIGTTKRSAEPSAAPALVDQPATPRTLVRVRSRPALRPAKRAIRWQLAAESGTRRTPPPNTFTTGLEQQLERRPPRPAPSNTPARVVRVRETQPVPGARRVLVTIARGTKRSQVTLRVICRRQCLVASIE